MRRVMLLTVVALLVPSGAWATWSVIGVDQATGQVAIASATCVPQASFAGFPARGLMDIQAIVVPGKGVAAAQAGVDNTRKNQMLIFRQLERGTSPAAIIEMLKADPNIERRQFGIVDLKGRRAGFSGTANSAASIDIQGRVPGKPVFFSIQGNILASEDVVRDAVAAFKATDGTLADRVMAAMDAADAKGGDKRCACDTPPKLVEKCESRHAFVAYLLEADRTDRNGRSFNDGHYALYLNVTDQNITPGEDADPVKTLQIRYDNWKKTHATEAAAHGQ